MKKITLLIGVTIFAICCKNQTKQEESSIDESGNKQEYTFTMYMDRYDYKKEVFVEDNKISKVQSDNDTTAYLSALTDFYNEKVNQRTMQNYGQPKGFLIVDEHNIDLSLKLTERMVKGFETQVTNRPEIKKMIDDYNRDSLEVGGM